MRTAKFSLRYRIIISVVAIETVMLSIMVWSNINQIRQTHLERLDQSAQVILQQFAATAGRHLFAVDYPSLREYAENVLKHNELIYVVVKDNSGNTIMAIGDPPKPERPQGGGEAASARVLQVREDVIFVGKPLGEVNLGFTLELMEQTVAAALRRGALIAATEIALSIMAALLIGIALTRNLGRLAEFAQRFGRGDPAGPLDIRSSDETGTLARAFNQMVSERQSVERALRESEEQYRATFEKAAVGICHVASDGRFLRVNQKLCDIVGYARDELLERSFADITHLDDRESGLDGVRRLLAGDIDTYAAEKRYLRKDGTIAWANLTVALVHRASGEPNYFIAVIVDITERKQTEATLRQFAAAIESTSEALALYDADDRLIFFNRAWRDFNREVADSIALGMTFEELMRVLIAGGLAPEAEGREEAWLRERLEWHRNPGDPIEIARQGGIWLLTNEHRLPDGGTITISLDITERKRAENALRESERDLMNLIEGSVQGVLIVTKERRPLFANRACARIFGFESPDQILALESTAELIGSHELDRLDEIRNSHFAEDKAPVVYEFDGARRDGSIVYLQCVARTVDWKGQRVAQITLLDVTERKRAEDALRHSEMRLRGILNISAEAIISVDPNQTIVMFNQGAQRIFGYGAEEVIGKPLAMLLPERVRATHRSHVEGFDKSRETTRLMMTERGEIAGLRKDGTEFPAEASISKLDLDDQRIFTVTLRDVSERKRAEEQLRQAQKMEAIGQLTGGIAHDFNNLLGVMLGSAEILSDRVGADDRHIQAVMRAATRGAELTQRMLAFSRQQPLEPKAIDAGALVDGMTDLLRRSLGETIAIKTTTGENLWTATADPGLVENALLNLAINARDAMPGGGNLIIETGNAVLDETYAATHDDVTAGDYVRLSVSDTGTGMTPEVLSHAFEPFYTTKDVGKGSGLGLSMVYGFAKQSGGHIAIYSEPGKGTTVNLYLPRTRAEAESDEVAPEEAVPRGRGETVLVVEDDEDIRAIVVGMLEDFGYRVRDAPDGAAGLALLEETPDIDLLITDMVLPGGLTGRDLAAEAERRFGVLKVLFMSGYSSEAVHLNGWVEKGADLLRKPFRRYELATKVRAVLDRGSGSAGPPVV